MRILCSAIRHFSAVAVVNKQITLSSSLHCYASACFLKHQFWNPVKFRPYCTHFQCLWPAYLPPATEWGYDEPGPDTWSSKYPDAGGENQSPIDIVTALVRSREYESPLAWVYEPPELCKLIMNTGCGWRVDVEGDKTQLSGGPLSSVHKLAQFHCHWGQCHTTGSEHTVDGRSYAGELHFVHWNKECLSIDKAIKSPKGLTVIGVFLEVGEKNSEIEKICEVLEHIPEKDGNKDLHKDFKINIDPTLMYPDNHSYWTYSGSLTTPPCFESVSWIVFKHPISVSEEQLNCFRKMKKACRSESGEDPGCVQRNYRPPQPLNDREIFEALC